MFCVDVDAPELFNSWLHHPLISRKTHPGKNLTCWKMQSNPFSTAADQHYGDKEGGWVTTACGPTKHTFGRSYALLRCMGVSSLVAIPSGVMTMSTFQSESVTGTKPASSNCCWKASATVHRWSTCIHHEAMDKLTQKGSWPIGRSDVGR